MNRLEAGCSTPISVRTHLMPGGIAGIRGDVAGKTRSLCLDVAVLSLDGGKCVEGKLATALPFAMPLDRAKRRRLDTEPSSTFPVLDEEISEVLNYSFLFFRTSIGFQSNYCFLLVFCPRLKFLFVSTNPLLLKVCLFFEFTVNDVLWE